MIEDMPFPRKADRNMNLVCDRDEQNLSFGELGKKYGIKKWTAWEIYHREKAREDAAEKKREDIHNSAAC